MHHPIYEILHKHKLKQDCQNLPSSLRKQLTEFW